MKNFTKHALGFYFCTEIILLKKCRRKFYGDQDFFNLYALGIAMEYIYDHRMR